jgi:hypothetical protein
VEEQGRLLRVNLESAIDDNSRNQHGNAFNVDVILRLLSILSETGPSRKTNLAGTSRMNYSNCAKYLKPVSITLGNLTNTGITDGITSIRNTTTYQLFNVTFNVPSTTTPGLYRIPAIVNEIGTNHTRALEFSIGVQ